MFHKKYNKDSRIKKTTCFFGLVLMAGILTFCLTSCGQAQKPDSAEENKDPLILETASGEEKETKENAGENRSAEEPGNLAQETEAAVQLEKSAQSVQAAKSTQSAAEDKALREQFGVDCITGQTFEVELSEYEGKVWFVPYASAGDEQGMHAQIAQNGEILTDIPIYVPEEIARKGFQSLEAVSFYDVNYDGNTDIVMISTYGGTRFASFYYGFTEGGEDNEKYFAYFVAQEQLSQSISSQVNPLSVSEIRSFLSGGKRNGSFSSYQEAYQAVSRLYEAEGTDSMEYGLIYFDEDDIPELTAGVKGYNTSLYTYQNGMVYTLMDRWSYGAMGNGGYEYAPKRNSLRNYNSDYAGAVLYTTYMTADSHHAMSTVVQIKTYNFDDSNKNGIPDEDELESIGRYSVSYIDDMEVGEEEWASYDVGGYEYIEPDMSLEQLEEMLKEQGIG